MTPELGHYALVLALALGLIQAIAPILGARANDAALMRLASSTALMQFVFVGLAFLALIVCYVTSDFSVATVYENAHSTMPLIYKVTSVWGNHEGSMLLWVLILSFFGALVGALGRNLTSTLKAYVLAVQSWIACAFYLFILFTSNPFVRLAQAPFEGRDLNPILQDIGLAIHPPLLYLGYVGFSIAFSFAIAALIEGRIDAAWARWVRPWTLAAWMFLTVGIAMGSYWAYYELGWGGFWFWDPVENASLMPWLAGTALLHSAVVMEKRNALKIWTLLLAILAFSLSLIGTFLVRSGVLTSVHTFANDPARGVFILAILVVFIGGGLSLFAWRAPMLKQGGLFAPISREGALVLNNLFLTTACLTVFVGTLYPLALEALTGEKISVGAPFFNLTFAPLFIPLMCAMPFGPLMAWKRGDILGAAQRLILAFGASISAVAVTFAAMGQGPTLAPFGIGLAVFVMIGAVTDIVERVGLFREPFRRHDAVLQGCRARRGGLRLRTLASQ
jgi:cytochrome c-type biogenesis protein CcmF